MTHSIPQPAANKRSLSERRRRVWSRAPPTPLFFIVHLRSHHKSSLVEPEVWLRRDINDSTCTWARVGMKQKDGWSQSAVRRSDSAWWRQEEPHGPNPAQTWENTTHTSTFRLAFRISSSIFFFEQCNLINVFFVFFFNQIRLKE